MSSNPKKSIAGVPMGGASCFGCVFCIHVTCVWMCVFFFSLLFVYMCGRMPVPSSPRSTAGVYLPGASVLPYHYTQPVSVPKNKRVCVHNYLIRSTQFLVNESIFSTTLAGCSVTAIQTNNKQK